MFWIHPVLQLVSDLDLVRLWTKYNVKLKKKDYLETADIKPQCQLADTGGALLNSDAEGRYQVL